MISLNLECFSLWIK